MGLLSRKKPTDDVLRHSKEIVIQNRNGLHARPAAIFVKISSRYRAEVWVEKDGERVNGKSIMGLMMLAAGQGSKLRFSVRGKDGAALLGEMEALFARKFDES
jgi:phosphocarrier protein